MFSSTSVYDHELVGLETLSGLRPDTVPATGNDLGRSQGLQAVIKLEGFRRLWIGQIFSQLADKFYIVLMVYLIAQYWVGKVSRDSSVLSGIASAIHMDLETRSQMITLLATGIYIANTIPAIMLGTVAGIWTDRWHSRPVMVGSNALRALLVLLTPFCLLPGPQWLGLSWGYWVLLIITFFESILTQFFAPAEQAAIALLVPPRHLLAANSLCQATSMGATIVGFALGEPILRLLRRGFLQLGLSGGEFLLLPFCYGMAALSLSTVQTHKSLQIRANNNIWREVSEGLQVLREYTSVRGAVIHLVLLYSLLAAMYVLAISLATITPNLGPTQFGTLLAMSGLGIAFGSVLVAQIGHYCKRRRLISGGLSMIAWSLAMLAQLNGLLGPTLLFCSLLGIGSAMVAIPAQTIIQEDTPETKRGKVFGLQNNLVNIALSLPLVLAGTLVGRYGVNPALWLLAGITLIAALFERPWEHC